MTKDIKKIGFIGLGLMGQPIASNLIKAGHDVTVYNRTRSKSLQLEELGARIAENPRELAERVDYVLTIVLDDEVLKNVIVGPQGLIEGLKPGSIVIDMTTVAPQTSIEIEKVLKKKEIGYLEAPVIRGPRGAIEGTLMLLVGGEKHLYEKCHDIFSIIGSDIYYLGPIGMGSKAKLINNFISHVNLVVACEALSLGKKLGLPADLLLEILLKGSAYSYILNNRGPGIVNETFDLKATLNVAYKDLGLILKMAQDEQALTLFPSIARQIQQVAMGMGLGTRDSSSVIKVYEELYRCNSTQHTK
ncbi:MAG: NAD(P)-dependent oxidoreductase [Bacillota bacterium]